MLVGGQAAPSHLGQQLGDGGIPGQIDPQHQGVDEKPDQLIERGIAAPGDREPHRHIGAGADLGQQHRQGGLDHHEAGRVVLARPPRAPAAAARPASPPPRWRRADRPPADRADRWAAAAARASRPARPASRPAARRCGCGCRRDHRTARAATACNRHTAPATAPTAGPGPHTGRIRHTQITHQRGDRPAVGGDMVHHAHQHVLVIGDAEKPCPQRDLGCQIKRVTRRVARWPPPAGPPTTRWHQRPPSRSRPARRAPPAAGVCRRAPANSVRRLSWRPTTSASAAPSASASRRPRSRNAIAML